MARQWIFQLQVLLCFGPTVIALALRGTPYYIAMSVVCAAFLRGAHADLGQSAQNIHAGADGARARGGAGRPVRHRPEQHAARPVHVRRRRASCGHESSLQRDDEPVRRSRASRRQRRRHHRRLRRRRIDLGGERKDDPLRNREFAGQGYHHHRSRRRSRSGRCHGHSSRWPAAAPSCCWKTSPSGATPKPESAIWRVTTN